MQNPRQPLGPFPREIVQNIANFDPQTYARLAQLNRRLGQTVQPVLQQVCQAPIRGYEIVRVLSKFPIYSLSNDNETVELVMSPYAEVQIKTENGRPLDFPLNEAGSLIDDFLYSGFKPNFYLVLAVYKNRLSCVNANPKYANELLVQEYLNRYNLIQNYKNRDNLFDYYNRLKKLVREFSQVIDFNSNTFDFYDEPDSLIEVEDAIEKLEAEGQRLVQLARSQ